MLNENLMERVLNRDNLLKAYKRVKANQGAPGVDGIGIESFAEHAKRHWPVIAEKLENGSYQPGAMGHNDPKTARRRALIGHSQCPG